MGLCTSLFILPASASVSISRCIGARGRSPGGQGNHDVISSCPPIPKKQRKHPRNGFRSASTGWGKVLLARVQRAVTRHTQFSTCRPPLPVTKLVPAPPTWNPQGTHAGFHAGNPRPTLDFPVLSGTTHVQEAHDHPLSPASSPEKRGFGANPEGCDGRVLPNAWMTSRVPKAG